MSETEAIADDTDGGEGHPGIEQNPTEQQPAAPSRRMPIQLAVLPRTHCTRRRCRHLPFPC